MTTENFTQRLGCALNAVVLPRHPLQMSISTQEIYGSVCRSAINDNVLPILVILRSHTFDDFAHGCDPIERGRHDRDLRKRGHEAGNLVAFLDGLASLAVSPLEKSLQTMHILISGICGFAGSMLALRLREGSENVKISGFDSFVGPGSEVNRLLLRRSDIPVQHAHLRNASDIDAQSRLVLPMLPRTSMCSPHRRPDQQSSNRRVQSFRRGDQFARATAVTKLRTQGQRDGQLLGHLSLSLAGEILQPRRLQKGHLICRWTL